MDMLYILALLACPIGMGGMMWMMMRRPSGDQGQHQSRTSAHEQELARLRAEIHELRTEPGRAATPDGR
ncbi:hypothetical protein CDO52_02660 [Nocardiopsis gilva YIM 90087]|uniref:DUF2933 domain-containing protein n=1 Tax=Nocardiopsis gilva YIM 90087 TaxID=1235441 RepID=A0A223S117_9ACTN|nr:hypothetical protein [Nocardiopsis gilva]ASU81832.1 hypothetical protein CDO52_02660 [Nocardiopsis gilva YIM 90087]